MKVLLFANTDWYLYNFRRSLAQALVAAGHEVVLLSPNGPYGVALCDLGLDWRWLKMDRRSLNPFGEALLIWRLWKLLRHERPDVVHCFTIKCAVYGGLAARLAGIPARISAVAGMGYVFTSNALLARGLRPLVRALLRLALAGRRARLILQNPDDVALFERAGFVDPGHIRLIAGSGVDCQRFQPQVPPRAPGRPLRVLMASRLLWDKGLAEFAGAARLLKASGRSVTMVLAGAPDPGNPAAVPEHQVQAWADAGELEWLGHVDDMPSLLASVDIVVLPSHREGCPKSLIEAAACGLPLVTTDAPGCRSVVSDGIDGLLMPVGSEASLAEAIGRLQDDPELAARLGRAARQKALAEFDERVVIARTLAVYAEIRSGDQEPTPRAFRSPE